MATFFPNKGLIKVPNEKLGMEKTRTAQLTVFPNKEEAFLFPER